VALKALATRQADISADGRYVTFRSDGLSVSPGKPASAGVFVRDRVRGVTTLVSVSSSEVNDPTALSDHPSISDHGRYVAFRSYSAKLVEDDHNDWGDIFVRDRVSGTTSRVSVSTAGHEADGNSTEPSISGHGRYVVFASDADNLVYGDSGPSPDIFLRDRLAGLTRRVSVNSREEPADGGGNLAGSPSVSLDGRCVAFFSSATNFGRDADATGDVFLRDRRLGLTRLVSVSRTGGAADGDSLFPQISADCGRVVFESFARNLVYEQVNDKAQIYLRDLTVHTTQLVSVSPSGKPGNDDNQSPTIAPGGNYVSFTSGATNLVAHDTNGREDVFTRGYYP